jgi:hypothetical protein
MYTGDLAGLVDMIQFRIGGWQEFGYENPMPDCKAIPPLGQRSAAAVTAGHDAVEEIDKLLARLYKLREQLVDELRENADIRMNGARA